MPVELAELSRKTGLLFRSLDSATERCSEAFVVQLHSSRVSPAVLLVPAEPACGQGERNP